MKSERVKSSERDFGSLDLNHLLRPPSLARRYTLSAIGWCRAWTTMSPRESSSLHSLQLVFGQPLFLQQVSAAIALEGPGGVPALTPETPTRFKTCPFSSSKEQVLQTPARLRFVLAAPAAARNIWIVCGVRSNPPPPRRSLPPSQLRGGTLDV